MRRSGSALAVPLALAVNPAYFWTMDQGQRLTRASGVRFLDTTLIDAGTGDLVFRSEGRARPDTLRRAVQRVPVL